LRNGARALLAQAVEAEVSDFLGKHADLKTRGWPPARCPPRSPAGTRGDDRIGRSPSASRVYATARRTLPTRPHPVLAIDPAPYMRRSKSIRDAAADPLPEGDLDRRLLRGAGGTCSQGRCRLSASAIGRLKDGWLDDHTRVAEADLSAKRYVYIWADGIHLQTRLEDEKQVSWC